MMLAVHPLADLIPAMSSDEFRDLRDDIQAAGLIQPITVYEGKVLDGRHRARACEELGVAIKTQPFSGDDPVEFVISMNLQRRHLTAGQRAAAALALLDYESDRARARQAAAGRKAAPGRPAESSPQERGSSHESEATAKAGHRLGVSRSSVERARRVAADRPDLHEKVKAGELSVGSAFEQTTGRALKAPRPVEVKSERQRQVAEKQRERLGTVIAGLDGYREGIEDFDVRRALAVADEEEIQQWVQMLGSSIRVLRELRTRLQQGG